MQDKTQSALLEHIDTLRIIDTHEHIPVEADCTKTPDVLNEWLSHYFSSDLVSAGLPEKTLGYVRDAGRPLAGRWAAVEPYWHAAENTGYGQSLRIAARDLFGVEGFDASTIHVLQAKLTEFRQKPGFYHDLLVNKARIACCIRTRTGDNAKRRPDEPIVYAAYTTPFITPSHYNQMRDTALGVGMEVHSLGDWMEVARRSIQGECDAQNRVVALKCNAAYQRSLRYDKVTYAEAEKDFNRLFEDRNLPGWRPGLRSGVALENFMMHHVCRIADDLKLPFQIHTGIQEGTGNFISDSNPTLLTNLFLEYRNVKFDIFHMGYPYMQELAVLAKNFQNVFIDMCWGHIISPEAARRALIEWLDSVPANKISAFGGDYCFIEGVYSHSVMARRSVAASLAEKVRAGSFSLARAKEIAGWLFWDNPRRLFQLDKYC